MFKFYLACSWIEYVPAILAFAISLSWPKTLITRWVGGPLRHKIIYLTSAVPRPQLVDAAVLGLEVSPCSQMQCTKSHSWNIYVTGRWFYDSFTFQYRGSQHRRGEVREIFQARWLGVGGSLGCKNERIRPVLSREAFKLTSDTPTGSFDAFPEYFWDTIKPRSEVK